MIDHETSQQAEALALRLICIADARHEADDHEGEAIARSVVDSLSDMLDLGWLREQRLRA